MLSRFLNRLIYAFLFVGLVMPLLGGMLFWSFGFFRHDLAGCYAVSLVLLGLVSWVVAGVLARWPGLRPTHRCLQAFGPPEELITAIDAELADTAGVVFVGKPPRVFNSSTNLTRRLLLTRSWLLQFLPTLEVRAVPLAEIIWVRKTPAPREAEHEFFVLVRTRKGVGEVFTMKKVEADQLLFELIGRLPWVMTGYNDLWEREWLSNRAQLLARVEDERQQIQLWPDEKKRAMVEDKITQARDAIEGPPQV
jgi:hypothetical protein